MDMSIKICRKYIYILLGLNKLISKYVNLRTPKLVGIFLAIFLICDQLQNCGTLWLPEIAFFFEKRVLVEKHKQ